MPGSYVRKGPKLVFLQLFELKVIRLNLIGCSDTQIQTTWSGVSIKFSSRCICCPKLPELFEVILRNFSCPGKISQLLEIYF